MGAEGKGIHWRTLATTGGLYIQTKSHGGNNREHTKGEVAMREWPSDQVAKSPSQRKV